MYKSLGRFVDAAKDYLRGINESLEQGNLFSAAYYAKEFERDGLRDALFIAALADARERKDLWWEIRALQELDWLDELRVTVEAHRQEIETSGDMLLSEVLAVATGDDERAADARKKMAEGTRRVPGGGFVVDTHDSQSDTEGSETDS